MRGKISLRAAFGGPFSPKGRKGKEMNGKNQALSSVLTSKDEEYFLGMGYLKKDLNQIRAAYGIINCENALGRRISYGEAMATLGRESFLSGIARAAFHSTAMREGSDGTRVFFDATEFFKSAAGEIDVKPSVDLRKMVRDLHEARDRRDGAAAKTAACAEKCLGEARKKISAYFNDLADVLDGEWLRIVLAEKVSGRALGCGNDNLVVVLNHVDRDIYGHVIKDKSGEERFVNWAVCRVYHRDGLPLKLSSYGVLSDDQSDDDILIWLIDNWQSVKETVESKIAAEITRMAEEAARKEAEERARYGALNQFYA